MLWQHALTCREASTSSNNSPTCGRGREWRSLLSNENESIQTNKAAQRRFLARSGSGNRRAARG